MAQKTYDSQFLTVPAKVTLKDINKTFERIHWERKNIDFYVARYVIPQPSPCFKRHLANTLKIWSNYPVKQSLICKIFSHFKAIRFTFEVSKIGNLKQQHFCFGTKRLCVLPKYGLSRTFYSNSCCVVKR